jgi:hypothetical protein
LAKLKSKLVREQHIFKAAVHKKKLKKKLKKKIRKQLLLIVHTGSIWPIGRFLPPLLRSLNDPCIFNKGNVEVTSSRYPK